VVVSVDRGTRLGPYEIIAPIGAGGMGEVYRARDTKLGRDVAIKILPEAFAQDAERMARFEREAKVLASLNHPNIAAIYGVENRALVMELVPGPTLAERIAQGPISMEEALPIAHQIAEALEYAHERGIVHRDLKPANIKIAPEGRVKVRARINPTLRPFVCNRNSLNVERAGRLHECVKKSGVLGDPSSLEGRLKQPPSNV
jgi:serine/threonine protein kinase